MIRSPYEAFVSFFFYVNRYPEIFRGRPPAVLIGKDIEHDDVIGFLAGKYRMHLNMSAQWVECGKSHVIRYEDLLADPVNELKNLAAEWRSSLSGGEIAEAVEYCSAERMKKNGGWKAGHIRSAKAKTWDMYLTDAHLRVFKDNYADMIAKIGYEVV